MNHFFLNFRPLSKNKIENISFNYVPCLDALRAIAAFAVIFNHIELLKFQSNLPNRHSNHLYNTAGQIGVVLFFVISGYIITTLLLREYIKNSTINVKHFFARRIFRILPLYYLILIFSAFLLNFSPSIITIILCFTFLSNIAGALNMGWLSSPHVWSIGVEEQFYICWPFIVKNFKKNLTSICISIFIIVTIAPHAIMYLLIKTNSSTKENSEFVFNFFFGAKYNCMALGAMVACFQNNKNSTITHFFKKDIALIFVLLPLIMYVFDFNFYYFTYDCYGIAFTLAIAHLSQRNYYVFNNKVTNFIGKISYGLYMYHWLVISLLVRYLFSYCTQQPLLFTLTVFGITIILSAVSYFTYEKYFLNLKEKYS